MGWVRPATPTVPSVCFDAFVKGTSMAMRYDPASSTGARKVLVFRAIIGLSYEPPPASSAVTAGAPAPAPPPTSANVDVVVSLINKRNRKAVFPLDSVIIVKELSGADAADCATLLVAANNECSSTLMVRCPVSCKSCTEECDASCYASAQQDTGSCLAGCALCRKAEVDFLATGSGWAEGDAANITGDTAGRSVFGAQRSFLWPTSQVGQGGPPLATGAAVTIHRYARLTKRTASVLLHDGHRVVVEVRYNLGVDAYHQPLGIDRFDMDLNVNALLPETTYANNRGTITRGNTRVELVDTTAVPDQVFLGFDFSPTGGLSMTTSQAADVFDKISADLEYGLAPGNFEQDYISHFAWFAKTGFDGTDMYKVCDPTLSAPGGGFEGYVVVVVVVVASCI